MIYVLTNETKTFYAFNIDKMFKAIFGADDEKSKKLLKELLSECLDIKIDKIIGFIPVELSARNKNERSKRLDLIVEVKGKKINIELNSSFNDVTRIRNLNYYFAFCSQHIIKSESYDIDSEFIHISLNYRAAKKDPLIAQYTLYDEKNKKELDERFKYYEINVEKFAKFWYDKDMKNVRKKPLLTMIGIKEEDELDKYSKEMDLSSIKESVDKLKTLNSDKKFVYDISPEEEETLEKNTLQKIAHKEGKVEGIEEGIEKTNENIVINLLKKDYPIKTIIDATGLSKEQIKEIELKNK